MFGVAAAWVWLGSAVWRRAPGPAPSLRTVTTWSTELSRSRVAARR